MNKNVLTNLFIFTAGAAAGAVVTWKLVKDKYAQIAQEEIDSVKEVFSRRENDIPKQEEETEESPDEEGRLLWGEEDIQEAEEVAASCGYFNYSGLEKAKPKEDKIEPYVIEPEEYGEKEGYEVITLYCFECGTLTNHLNEPVDDVENLVGKDFRKHIGEYEDDCVHIRNDELKMDIEILQDMRRYSDLGTTVPYMEDE
jgi:hypothetical protein